MRTFSSPPLRGLHVSIRSFKKGGCIEMSELRMIYRSTQRKDLRYKICRANYFRLEINVSFFTFNLYSIPFFCFFILETFLKFCNLFTAKIWNQVGRWLERIIFWNFILIVRWIENWWLNFVWWIKTGFTSLQISVMCHWRISKKPLISNCESSARKSTRICTWFELERAVCVLDRYLRAKKKKQNHGSNKTIIDEFMLILLHQYSIFYSHNHL